MKFAARETGATEPLRNCTIVLPKEQYDYFDLSFCASNCIFVESLEEAMKYGGRIAIMDIRMEEVDKALKWVASHSGRRLQIVVPHMWNDMVQFVMSGDDANTLDQYTVHGSHILLGVRKAKSSDRSIADFKYGMEIGEQVVGRMASEDRSDRKELQKALDKMDALMRYIEEQSQLLLTRLNGSTSNQDERKLSPGSENERANLLNELVKVRNEFDALQRKYDALSSSTLGSLTLRMWERKK
ncbi:hypothetical protein [Actinomyces trachealis]|uniref:hypothetical protein n=1 Tax=Actinomyces trachealis TaxID=2763540 RepID=UPI0018C75B41|nr:hypothetical protein [Actinomyces trachealis]